MTKIIVHARINKKHPEISEENVRVAFDTILASATRADREHDEHIAIGCDDKGRLLELVYTQNEDGDYLIFHAFTPPTKKAMFELGITRRK